MRKKLKDKNLSNKERIKILKSNPILFGEFYIKPYIKKWDTKTANHHYELIYNILAHKNSITHVPVEHAKSTWITLVLPVWFMANDIDTQGAIISGTARQAEGFLSVIKWHIEYNKRLKRDFPYLRKGKKWTEAGIIIKRSNNNTSKDMTIIALGIGGEILGARLDWVILDDALSINNSRTKDGRTKIENWFNQMVDGRIQAWGRRILVGTLQHNDDLLCTKSLKHYEILEGTRKDVLDPSDFHYVRMSAIDEKTNTPLWPEKWPLKRLEEALKRIGTIAYLKTLMNDRKARIGKLFNPNWLHYYKIAPSKNFNIVIGFDPALSKLGQAPEDREGDECGLCVLLNHWETNTIYLLEEFAKHLDFNEQLKEVKRFYLKYKSMFDRPVIVAVEGVYYQDALSQKLFADGINAVGVPVHKDKVTRMEFLSADVETGRVLIKEEHFLFINEFIEFEANYTKSPNVLDACNTGVCYIKNRKPSEEEDDEILKEMSLV